MKMKSRVEKTFIYGILIFFSLLFLAPLFWMVTTSLKSPEELYLFPPKWIPSSLHFENFKEAWISQPFTQFLMNSLTVTILATLGQIVSSALVAYGFARFTFKGRDFLFMVLLATMMIPWEVTMIPLYMEFNFLRLDQYVETADCSCLVRCSILYLLDAPIHHGYTKRTG